MIKGITYPIQNIYDNEFAAEGPVSTKIDIPVSKSTACVFTKIIVYLNMNLAVQLKTMCLWKNII